MPAIDPQIAARLFVLNAESDARIARESFVDGAKDMIDRLGRIVAEIEERGTYSLLDLSVVRDTDLNVKSQRLMQSQYLDMKARALFADLGFEA